MFHRQVSCLMSTLRDTKQAKTEACSRHQSISNVKSLTMDILLISLFVVI